jgi:hypothetical protein
MAWPSSVAFECPISEVRGVGRSAGTFFEYASVSDIEPDEPAPQRKCAPPIEKEIQATDSAHRTLLP